MNEPFDQHEISDEELSRRLQNVSLPKGLKESLLAIPDQSDLNVGSSERLLEAREEYRRPVLRWSSGVLAASLFIAVALLAWVLTSNTELSNVAKAIDHASDMKRLRQEAKSLLRDFQETQTIVEAKLRQNERVNFERQLDSIPVVSSRSISTNDVDSMIFALASEASLTMGNSRSNVQQSMQHLLQSHPGTPGAILAESFLNQN